MPHSIKKWAKAGEIRASGIFRIRKDILSNYLWAKLRNIIFNHQAVPLESKCWGDLVDLCVVRQLGYLFRPKWFKHFKLLSH